MQRVIAIGTVSSKGELAKMPEGTRMAKLTLSCEDENVPVSGEKHIQEELPIVMWNRKADMSKYINIGDKLFVEGRLKSTMIKVRFRNIRSTEVVVNSFDFLSPRRSETALASGVARPFGVLGQITNQTKVDCSDINGDDFREWTGAALSGRLKEDTKG